nr:protein ACCELERATED CELL DEATH 6-like [Ipomoea batatas]
MYLLAVTHLSYKTKQFILDKDKITLLKSIKFADDRVRKFLKHENNIPGEEEKDKIGGMIETGKTSIVVATLILTMTFAAGIAVPGGYNQEKGYPIFLGNAAFKAFIVTNTIAFLCSFCSIALHIAMVSEASRYSRSFETVLELNDWQHILLAYSCYGVVIAFPCAMYVTLAPLRIIAIVDLTIGIYIGSIAVLLYNLLYS